MNDDRGSVWRKWDLHIHTPSSYLNGYDENWDGYVDDIIEKSTEHGVEAFATADYFTVDGYEKLLEYYDKNTNTLQSKTDESIKRKICIVPGIELRVKVFNDDNASINLHVMFDTNCTPNFIRENFISELEFSHRGTPYKITPNNLLAVGKAILDNVAVDLNIDHDSITEILKSKYYEACFKSITLEKDNIKEAIKMINKTLLTKGKKPAIVAVAVKGHGGIDSLEWFDTSGSMSRSGLTREDFSADADLFFSCSQADAEFYTGQSAGADKAEIIRRFKRLKPCIWGSDAHEKENLFHPSRGATKKYTWIKADATFEGLKQIIYEPLDRIKIQETNPYEDFQKPYFSEINIQKGSILETPKPKFDNTALKLNRDMVAIIGSRGGGKSLLIDVLSVMFKHQAGGEGERLNRIQNTLGYKVDYTKTDGVSTTFDLSTDNNLNYLHVHQGQVKSIVTNHKTLDREIKKLLGIKISDEEIIEDEKVEQDINKAQRYVEFFESRNDKGILINTQEFQKARKKVYEDLISTITTAENKEKIDEYRQNSIRLEFLEEKKASLENLAGNLELAELDFEDEISGVNSVALSIESDAMDILAAELSEGALIRLQGDTFTVEGIPITPEISDALESMNEEDELVLRYKVIEEMTGLLTPVPKVDFEDQRAIISLNIEKVTQSFEDITAKNKQIKQDFINSGIKIDVNSLLDKVGEYQRSISTLEKNIVVINNRRKELNNLISRLYLLGAEIQTSLQTQKQEIEDRWDVVKNPANQSPEQLDITNKLLEDIDVSGIINFNTDEFYRLLAEDLNMTRFKPQKGQAPHERLQDVFNVKDFKTYVDLVSGKNIIRLNDELLTLGALLEKPEYFNQNSISSFLYSIYLNTKYSSYLSVESESTYLGRKPTNLSVGQRGTFYVCVKLATDSFSTPLVFDQPDDDLDSDFIVSKLVPIFREIKKYRQVIIISHNPNFVVNTDVEQVIVAKNKNEVLSYDSGSIENESIRKSIYQILEGGKDAFLEREEKYGF